MESSKLNAKQARRSHLLHHVTLGLVALVAVVNTFITIFGNRSETVWRLRASCGDPGVCVNWEKNSENSTDPSNGTDVYFNGTFTTENYVSPNYTELYDNNALDNVTGYF